MKELLIIGAGVIAYQLWRQYYSITYGVKMVRFGSIRNGKLKVEIDLMVSNGSLVTLPIDGFLGGIFDSSGNKIGQVGLIKPAEIAAGATEVIRVGADVNVLQAAASIPLLIKSKGADLILRGTLFLGDVRIPVNTSLEW